MSLKHNFCRFLALAIAFLHHAVVHFRCDDDSNRVNLRLEKDCVTTFSCLFTKKVQNKGVLYIISYLMSLTAVPYFKLTKDSHVKEMAPSFVLNEVSHIIQQIKTPEPSGNVAFY